MSFVQQDGWKVNDKVVIMTPEGMSGCFVMPKPFPELIDGRRPCSICGLWKELGEFSPAAKSPFGRMSKCKECGARYMRERRASLPQVSRAKPETVAKKKARVALFSEGKRQCSTCKTVKMFADFDYASKIPDRLNYRCKDCCRASSKRWFAVPGNREKNLKKITECRRTKRYGLGPDALAAMLRSQDGGCAICSTPLDLKARSCHVDHDHVSGANRGLLCGKCNSGLGFFRDNVDFLNSAITYLRKAKGIVT